MIRRIALCACAAALAGGGMAMANTDLAGAKVTPVNATGTATCALTGKVKVSPALAIPGTGAPATLTTKIKIVGCTGTSGVTSGKGTITSQVPSDNCTVLQTAHPVSATGVIKWKGAGKYNPSTITFSDGSTTISDPITSSAPGPGTSTITGSFAGQHAASTEVLDQQVAGLVTACTGKKGLKKLSFTGVQGASSFNITL